MTGQLVWLCTCGLPTRNGAGSKCAACRPKKIRRKSSCKAWSDADLRTLRTEWHELSERRLRERFPGRSWLAILHKATELGLPMGVPQGHVSVERAITELGLTRPTFFAICEARSVRVRLRLMRWARAEAARRVPSHLLGTAQVETRVTDCASRARCSSARAA